MKLSEKELHINALCKRYKITAIKEFKSAVGRANITRSTIFIPIDLNVDENYLVALHEIGHIIEGKVKPKYYSEYLAGKYALDTGKQNVTKEAWEAYKIREEYYTLININSALIRKANINNIQQQIIYYIEQSALREVFEYMCDIYVQNQKCYVSRKLSNGVITVFNVNTKVKKEFYIKELIQKSSGKKKSKKTQRNTLIKNKSIKSISFFKKELKYINALLSINLSNEQQKEILLATEFRNYAVSNNIREKLYKKININHQ